LDGESSSPRAAAFRIFGMGNDNERLYQVVVNHEEQYSIWPADGEPPPGWSVIGFTGPKDNCLSRIAEIWTDMRPLSLRRALAGAADE
jgi:MbtH protein